MGLNVGNLPVKQVYVGSTPVRKVYVGSKEIWSAKEVVQITLGTGYQARDQFRAALSARGLNYGTVTEIPFDIKLVGTGVTDHMFDFCSNLTAVPALNTSGSTSMKYMFRDCKNLKEAPAMDTSNVTDMTQMFYQCSSMTYVPDMHTSQASVMGHMFFGCSALTDGNVRLIGKHPNVNTNLMIYMSGLTREPWYTADGRPIDVYEVSQSRAWGDGRVYTLVSVTVPAGETWQVRIQGTVTETSSTSTYWPNFRIGTADSGRYGQNAAVDFSGTITAANSTIAMVTNSGTNSSFVGTVTIEI